MDDFHKRSAAKDGRQQVCKECNKSQRKAYYKTATGRANDMANGKRAKQRLYLKLIEFLSDKACVDCGESDMIVLEFDHRETRDKLFTINEAVRSGVSWERILAEIDKCDIRCANCHRRRTAVQFNWIKGR